MYRLGGEAGVGEGIEPGAEVVVELLDLAVLLCEPGVDLVDDLATLCLLPFGRVLLLIELGERLVGLGAGNVEQTRGQVSGGIKGPTANDVVKVVLCTG
jgi:hypothetical protein